MRTRGVRKVIIESEDDETKKVRKNNDDRSEEFSPE